MKANALALVEGAEKEARVAMGIDRYLYQRMTHRVADSDPDTDGDDEDGAPDAYDCSDPKVLEKILAQPPVTKQGPTQPPRDANDALPGDPETNAVAKEGDVLPLLRVMRYADNEHVHEMRNLLIKFGAANGVVEL